MSLLRPADVHRHFEPHERARTWRDDAACIGTPPATFEIPHGMSWASPEGRILAARARAICDTCPVVAQCLADAGPGDDTIRGGLTPDARGPRKQTHCAKGHDTTDPDARHKNRTCKQCTREQNARRRARTDLRHKETQP